MAPPAGTVPMLPQRIVSVKPSPGQEPGSLGSPNSPGGLNSPASPISPRGMHRQSSMNTSQYPSEVNVKSHSEQGTDSISYWKEDDLPGFQTPYVKGSTQASSSVAQAFAVRHGAAAAAALSGLDSPEAKNWNAATRHLVGVLSSEFKALEEGEAWQNDQEPPQEEFNLEDPDAVGYSKAPIGLKKQLTKSMGGGSSKSNSMKDRFKAAKSMSFRSAVSGTATDILNSDDFEFDGLGMFSSKASLQSNVYSKFMVRIKPIKIACNGIVKKKGFRRLFTVLTLYALFVPDIDVSFGNKESLRALGICTTIVMGLFYIELIICSFGRVGFFASALFWLDLVAVLSLLPDTALFQAFLGESLLANGRVTWLRAIRVASRSSKATRFTRITRIARVASLIPRVSAFFGESSRDQEELEKRLERKLRRMFVFLDEDMDGKVPLGTITDFVEKIKMENDWTPKVTLMSKMSKRLMFRQRTRSSDSQSSGNSHHREDERRPVVGRARSTSTVVRGALVGDLVNFNDFRQICLRDEWLREYLAHLCKPQTNSALSLAAKKTKTASTITKQQGEVAGVRVALGVLLMLLILGFVQPDNVDTAGERGLRQIDRVVRESYHDHIANDTVPGIVRDFVATWQAGAQPRERTFSFFPRADKGQRKLVYLDLDKKVYCNELIEDGQTCSPGASADFRWMRLRSSRTNTLDDVDEEIRTGDFRISIDLSTVTTPTVSNSLTLEEQNDATFSVAVIDQTANVQQEAIVTLLNTCFVIVLIVGGILVLVKDLNVFSRGLLRPLQELAEEMQSIGQLQLAGMVSSDVSSMRTSKVKEIKHLRRTFESLTNGIKSWGKYVPWPVVQILLHAGVEAKPLVMDKEVTIFFSDIANFTSIVESIPPERSLLLLSRYFNDMSKVIEVNQGIVLEFIGDAIMCIYGAPVRNAEHPTAAVRSTLKMLSALRRINEWSVANGLPEVRIRCGVHTGNVLVGNMGFQSRLKYGIVGQESNIPCRLEEMNKNYGTSMLMSELTYQRLQVEDFVIRPIDFVHLRPQDVSVQGEKVYEVLDRRKRHTGPLEEAAAVHADALARYGAKNFSQAAALFKKSGEMMKTITGKEDMASSVMLKRCEAYKRTPPPAIWSCVWDAAAGS